MTLPFNYKPPTKQEKQRQLKLFRAIQKKCREKTAKGNVQKTERESKLEARRMSKKCCKAIRPYKCQHCSWWHVGGELAVLS